MHNKQTPLRQPRYSITMLSATALAYEILLMRLFSIIQWHHFAYMIISLALLGYGASGSFLSLTLHRLRNAFAMAYIINIFLFTVSILVCFLSAQALPFNAQAIFWDLKQPLYLLLMYLLLSLPFFFAANAIGLAFIVHRSNISQLYAADMIGAGLGSIVIIGLLFLVFPVNGLKILTLFGVAATLYAIWELRGGLGFREPYCITMIAILFFISMLPPSWLVLNPSPYKGLSQALQVSGSAIVNEYSSPLGQLTVVENTLVPFRHAPGLSLNATTEPPRQIGIFTDGEGMSVISENTGDRKQFVYLDQLTSALPYHLSQPQRVLILGAGGGSDVLQAKYHGVEKIDAVELDPQMVSLMKNEYREFSGQLYNDATTRIHVAEARGFVRGSRQKYDLIHLSLLDSFSASSAGLYALSENYLYTKEALQDYYDHLQPNGVISLTRWIKLPPRDSLKLFATAVEALRSSGIKEIGNKLLLIRSWQTSTLLIKKGTFTAKEIQTLKQFSRQRYFDTAYYPGIELSDTNQYNLLQRPFYYEAAIALLGERHRHYLQNYKFNLQPATDDRPYFFNFFKWSALPEILNLSGHGGMPLLEWGYLVLIATLLQALVVSIVLILLPLFIWKRKDVILHGSVWLSFTYFFLLGLAFLFVEIAFMQKFILFLHHPLYAIAVVLAAFLLFAGMGSAWSKRYNYQNMQATGIKYSITAIAILGVLYLLILEPLFTLLLALPVVVKIGITVVLIAPMAFFMGMPFPLGLNLIGKKDENLIPWVWGVNGCASVLSAVLATLLAIQYGFTMVIIFALICYFTAAILSRATFGIPTNHQV